MSSSFSVRLKLSQGGKSSSSIFNVNPATQSITLTNESFSSTNGMEVFLDKVVFVGPCDDGSFQLGLGLRNCKLIVISFQSKKEMEQAESICKECAILNQLYFFQGKPFDQKLCFVKNTQRNGLNDQVYPDLKRRFSNKNFIIETQDFTTESKVMHYEWGCWQTNSNIYGALLFSIERTNDFSEEHQLAMESLLVIAKKNKITPTILIFEVGAEQSLNTDSYPESTQIIFLNLPTHGETEKQIICFLNLMNFENFDYESIQKTMGNTMNSFLNSALSVARKLYSGKIVLIQKDMESEVTFIVLRGLLLILMDSYFRTKKGFWDLIHMIWIDLKHENIWLHFLLFIFCVYELICLFSSAFEFDESFLHTILDLEKENLGQFEATFTDSTHKNNVNELYQWPKSITLHYYFANLVLQLNPSISKSISELQNRPNDQDNPIFDISAINLYSTSILTGWRPTNALKAISLKETNIYWMLPSFFSKNLTKLILDGNKLRHVPDVVSKLENLTTLSVSENYIETISPMFQSTSLTDLKLEKNLLKDLSWINQFSSLTSLSLATNLISKISINILALEKLQILKLNQNKLVQFPNYLLPFLTCLKHLDFSSNNITTLPGHVKNDTLKFLSLEYNKITSIPTAFGSFTSMQKLILSNNSLTEIPMFFLNYKKLKVLEMASNFLEEIPFWIFELVKLKKLDLKSNYLNQLPSTIAFMTSLKQLDVSMNRLTTLPPHLRESLNLNIADNPLHVPPQIFTKGTNAITSYFTDSTPETVKPKWCKILIIGHKNSGKSSLMRSLGRKWTTGNDLSENHNIINMTRLHFKHSEKDPMKLKVSFRKSSPKQGSDKISKFSARSGTNLRQILETRPGFRRIMSDPRIGNVVKVMKTPRRKEEKLLLSVDIWEIGTETGNISHPLFLSSYPFSQGIIVVIVISLDKPDDDYIDHWLRIITKRRSSVRVVLVGTHYDKMRDKNPKAILQAYYEKYKSYFQIISMCMVSNETTENIAELSSVLEELILQNMIEKEVPEGLLNFETILKDKQKLQENPIISQTELFRLAFFTGLKNVSDVINMTKILHDFNQIFWFNAVPKLKNFVILNPLWFFGAIQRFFNHSQTQSGLFSKSKLKSLWQDIPESIQDKLLAVLKYFGFAFSFPYTEKKWRNTLLGDTPLDISCSADDMLFFVPSLLPKRMTLNATDLSCSLTRVYQKAFFPFNALVQIMMVAIEKLQVIDNLGYLGIAGKWKKTILNVHLDLNVKTEEPKTDELIIYVTGEDSRDVKELFSFIIGKLEAIIQPQVTIDKTLVRSSKIESATKGKTDTLDLEELLKCLRDLEHSVKVNSTSIPLDELIPDYSLPEYQGKWMNLHVLIENSEPPIGIGAFGTVYKAKLSDNRKAAIKILNHPAPPASTSDFRNEIRIQSVLKCPQIVSVLAIHPYPLAVAFELCMYGSLYTILHSDEFWPISWEVRLKILVDISLSLKYLHSLSIPIAHLDMKSANIGICSLSVEDPVLAKITDFGTAQRVKKRITLRKVDSPFWLAPEILQETPEYTEKVDTYAFGMVAWEVLTRNEPFSNLHYITAQEAILSGDRPHIPPYCSEEYKELITRCWAQSPDNRPPWDWVLDKLTKMQADFRSLDKLCPFLLRSVRAKRTKSQPVKQKKLLSRVPDQVDHQPSFKEKRKSSSRKDKLLETPEKPIIPRAITFNLISPDLPKAKAHKTKISLPIENMGDTKTTYESPKTSKGRSDSLTKKGMEEKLRADFVTTERKKKRWTSNHSRQKHGSLYKDVNITTIWIHPKHREEIVNKITAFPNVNLLAFTQPQAAKDWIQTKGIAIAKREKPFLRLVCSPGIYAPNAIPTDDCVGTLQELILWFKSSGSEWANCSVLIFTDDKTVSLDEFKLMSSQQKGIYCTAQESKLLQFVSKNDINVNGDFT